MSDTTVSEKSKERKGFLKNKILVLILGIATVLLMGGIVVGGSFLIPKDIEGAWALVVNPEMPATQDEISEANKAYYVFEKPDKYGRGDYYTCYQGGIEYYKYQLMEENSVNKINLGTEDMEYRITGSKLLGNAELTIVFPQYTDETTGKVYEAQEYVFEQAKNPQYERQCYKVFETDNKLLKGKWTTNERTLAYFYYSLPYTQTVEFSENGIMIIHYESPDLGLDRYMYYAYTAKNGELTFSLVTDKETKYTVGYEFDQKGNLVFVNDTTASSIFADAFFGNFTFYTSENSPEPSGASSDQLYFTE